MRICVSLCVFVSIRLEVVSIRWVLCVLYAYASTGPFVTNERLFSPRLIERLVVSFPLGVPLHLL